MNCESYRQAIAEDPSESFDGGALHAESCASCRAARDELQALDRRIAAALNIPVPALELPELPEPEVAASVSTLPQRRRMSTPTWFGMAAGIALAAYFGLQALAPDVPPLSLADQVVAHLDHEAGSRVISNDPVSERTLNSVVSKEVVQMSPGIGLITYARSCEINGRIIPHLVIQGERGPVTLLLLPDEPIDGPIPLTGRSINGVILPLGEGSIAIIGVSEERIDDVSHRVIDSVKWST